MISRITVRAFRRAVASPWAIPASSSCRTTILASRGAAKTPTHPKSRCMTLQSKAFHTSTARPAQSPTADALMEDLNELYATAKDEFEIAAEETEKKTVYAEDDREAAQDALKMLQEGFQKAIKESAPEVAKEVQSRVGPRMRELENAVKAMEEMALEE